MKSISPQTFLSAQLHHSDVLLIDVRSDAEYQREHAVGSQSLPLNRVTANAVRRLQRTDTEMVYVLCERGYRARLAIERLAAEGFDDAVLVEGGTDAWIEAGLPSVRGPREKLGLQRGLIATEALLVLLGGVLGFTLHIGFLFALAGLGIGLGAVHDWQFQNVMGDTSTSKVQP
jgi:rhodanese-related sulfurtransferase